MARIPDEKLNQIRQSVDIVDVIGSYLPLTKKGRNYVTICPFHNDTNPSLSISPERQIYKCFVCGKGGNVFTFLQDYLKISWIEAVKEVAARGNVDVDEYHLEERKVQVDKSKEPLFNMHQEALKIYQYYLNTKAGVDAKEYLHQRYIDKDIIDYFEIGYAPTDNYLYKALTKLEFKEIDMFKSGLIIEAYQKFDRFNDRIMFPIHDSYGRVIAFSGRIYRKSQKDSKYMNSPESDIFIKGDTLYNYHRIKDAVRDKGRIIICEGFMDVVALYKADIKNAVAIMGTALTRNHINLIKRLTTNVVMCLDGDNAGQGATLKCIEALEKANINCFVVGLPKDLDPDEVLNQKGSDELRSLIDRPKNALEFKIDYYYNISNMANFEDRKEYVEKMANIISTLDDPLDIDHYVQIVSEKVDFNKETILSLVTKDREAVKREVKKVEFVNYKQTRGILDKYEKAENYLLYYMMEDKKYCDIYQQNAGFMINNINRIISMYIVDYYRKYNKFDVAGVIDDIKDEKIKDKLLFIADSNLPAITDDSIINDYIDCIKSNATTIQQENELRKLMENTTDNIQKARLADEIIKLKNKG